MDKYIKRQDAVCKNYVTYYRHGKSVSQSFQVRYNSSDEVDLVKDMEKMININKDWYVNSISGNITKEEFDKALNEAILFLTKQ
jgi:hypothetical protein